MRYHKDVLKKNSAVLKAENYTEDEDISTTLDSIKESEHLMGYRGPPPTNKDHAWGSNPEDFNVT